MIILGLGSNIGDRVTSLSLATTLIIANDILSDVTVSSTYESEAVLENGSPAEWRLPYLNQAIKGQTRHDPEQLLAEIQQIEQVMGRQNRGKWAPREIDIDILAYGQQVLQLEHLFIPHPALLIRNFALFPLAEICPEWTYPMPGEHYNKTAQQLKDDLLALQPHDAKIICS
jgi:2-amino-4-hydroxy-6-hydroxymethyldihydropteridine diphosphokinase